jgi:hypothetical protein
MEVLSSGIITIFSLFTLYQVLIILCRSVTCHLVQCLLSPDLYLVRGLFATLVGSSNYSESKFMKVR